MGIANFFFFTKIFHSLFTFTSHVSLVFMPANSAALIADLRGEYMYLYKLKETLLLYLQSTTGDVVPYQ